MTNTYPLLLNAVTEHYLKKCTQEAIPRDVRSAHLKSRFGCSGSTVNSIKFGFTANLTLPEVWTETRFNSFVSLNSNLKQVCFLTGVFFVVAPEWKNVTHLYMQNFCIIGKIEIVMSTLWAAVFYRNTYFLGWLIHLNSDTQASFCETSKYWICRWIESMNHHLLWQFHTKCKV